MLVVDGKICPQCGWDGGSGKDEAIVYLKCPECDTEWLDGEARLTKTANFRDRPAFLAGPKLCSICERSTNLCFWFCLDKGKVIIECDE